MGGPASGVYLNLDDAWGDVGLGMAGIDVRDWGARLRYHGKRAEVDEFYRQVGPRLGSFVLYGSGDYHYLSGILLRRARAPVTVISFDNHPDWDIRPPYWSCGGWVNRALELAHVRSVSVWGCGSFELRFPSRLFASRAALKSGKVQVHAWAERQSASVRRRFDCMTRQNWRDRFGQFSSSLSGHDVYVTIDLDCLCAEEAITNWESGLFTADDIAWALWELRGRANVIAGDLCGAYSMPQYDRTFQRFAAWWDHPKAAAVDLERARRVNSRTLQKIWPALLGDALASGHEGQTDSDQGGGDQ